MHDDIANRRHRHVVLQGLPLRPVVEGDVNAQFGGGVEQPLGFGVFLHRVDVGAVGDAGDHVLPGLAAIVRAIDMRLVIGNAMAIHRRVGSDGIEMAGFDPGNLAPRRHGRRRDVGPRLAIVAGDVDQAIVGAHPDGSGLERRGADGIDHAEAVGHRLVDVLGRDGVERGGHSRVEAREVGADLFPGAAAVARAHDELIGVVERFIGRGEDLGKRPRFAVGIVGFGRRQLSAERSGHVEGLIAAPVAVAVEDVAVLGVGDDGGAFAGQAGGLPVAHGERAHARPGADADAAAILLRAVEPVGETIVGGDVIELGGGLVVPGAPGLSDGLSRNVNVAIPTLAGRIAADPFTSNDPDVLPGQTYVAAPDGPDSEVNTGYLWDSVLRAKLTVRNYGFFLDTTLYGTATNAIAVLPNPFSTHTTVAYPANAALTPYTDPYFRGFDNSLPDYYRYQEWEREFDTNYAKGGLPALTLVRFMHDHTGNFPVAIAGVNTPYRMVADNDYAVGLLIQKIANSPVYANNTLIFVVEDDAQDGGDHMDSHRSIAFVAGAYVKQNAVVSTPYNTIDFVRTIEEVLGLPQKLEALGYPPMMNLNDALAHPMTDIFNTTPSPWTFTATPSACLYAPDVTLL